MAEDGDKRDRLIDKILCYCPSALNALRLFILCIGVGIATYWTYFHKVQQRTVIVDAKTGALDVTLSNELRGKEFRSVYLCMRGDPTDDGVLRNPPPVLIGCPRTHQLYGPIESLTPSLPIGTELRLTSLPGSLRIDVRSIPGVAEGQGQYVGTEVAKMVGGAFVLVGEPSIGTFGTLPLRGAFHLGARDEETGRVSITEGRYQIRGFTLVGLIGGDTRELRGGTLQAGAFLRFVDRRGDSAPGSLAIMMDNPEDTTMRVTAISARDTSNLAVRYYFTEEVVIRPSFIEAVILDPLFQLLATILGMFAGYGWLRRVLSI